MLKHPVLTVLSPLLNTLHISVATSPADTLRLLARRLSNIGWNTEVSSALQFCHLSTSIFTIFGEDFYFPLVIVERANLWTIIPICGQIVFNRLFQKVNALSYPSM